MRPAPASIPNNEGTMKDKLLIALLCVVALAVAVSLFVIIITLAHLASVAIAPWLGWSFIAANVAVGLCLAIIFAQMWRESK
jgi:hypothetical protein